MMLQVKVNPWDKETICQKGKEYIRNYNSDTQSDFSWVLDDDKKALKLDKADSINWGLPNQVIGNPKTANLFLCLLNPRINDRTTPYKDFKGYVAKESQQNPEEYFEDVDMYYQHIIQTNQNVLAKEIRNLQQESDFDKKWTDYKSKKTENNPLRKQYYLFSYYYYLLRDGGSKIDFYRNLRNQPIDYFDNLKTCDLELFPYRTENAKGIHFQKGKSFKDLASSRYVASLIIDRVFDFSTSEKPVFIFRSYNQWSKVIMEVLRRRAEVNENEEVDEEELIDQYNLLTDYFYEFTSNQNGAITEKNIHKVMKLGEYDEIRNCIRLENQE